jgi:chromosome segregation ATPase
LVGASAFAHGPEGAQLPKDPPAVAPAGEQARAAIAEIEASHGQAASIAKSAIEAARAALARAHGASLASDASAAVHLSKIALAWSDAARAVVQSAAREREAVDAEARAARLEDDHERARAALETADARRRQLEDELARAEEAVARARAASIEPERKRLGARPGASGSAPRTPTSKVPASSKKNGASR